MSEEVVLVGRVAGPFGLRGQLKIDPNTEFVQRFEAGARLRILDHWYEVTDFRIHKKRPLIRLEGVKSATDAETLKFADIYAPADVELELEEDEFLSESLLGVRVVTVEGEELGVVDEVMAYPAQDLLRIGELLIPVVQEFVKEIDLEVGKITVQLLPGMREA